MDAIFEFLGGIDEYLYSIQIFVLAVFFILFLPVLGILPEFALMSLFPSVFSKDQAEMIGGFGTVVSWNDKKGRILYEGEIWQAKSGDSLALNKDDQIVIKSRNKMTLIVVKG